MESKALQPAGRVGGVADVPCDKSISHRAVILGALSVTPTRVENFLSAEDCLANAEAFRQMGIQIEHDKNQLQIKGKGLEGLKAPTRAIDCGNSGTTTRLLMGVLTGQPFDVELVGDASLSKRPMARVMKPLSEMGAFFTPKGPAPDRLPLRVHGTHSVRSITWKSPVASAQVKSAILLAGLYASGTTEVEEPSLSRDHTERMLKACGVQIERQGTKVSVTGTATVRASEFKVPGDLSSAAFLLAAGVLASSQGVTVRHVGVNPTRTGFLDVLKNMGVNVQLQHATETTGEPASHIEVTKSTFKALTIADDLNP